MKKKQLLICDDEEGTRESLKLILSDDYDLKYAEDSEEILQKVKDSPDLSGIMLDIKMPRKNGLDVLREVRSYNNDIPVIIVTGYQSVEAANEVSRLGASNYLVKPFESKSVLETVEKSV